MDNGRWEDVFIIAVLADRIDPGKSYSLGVSFEFDFPEGCMGTTNLVGDTRSPFQVSKALKQHRPAEGA